VLVLVAPALWFVFAVWVSREASVRSATATAARFGALTLLTSAWWIAGLSVQATNGIEVLRYTETADTVAATSTAHEVLRGLGLWVFYSRDRVGPLIDPAESYTQSLWLLAVTFAIPSLALLGAAVARWRYRSYFAGLLLTGTVLAVGAHPWDDPSPAGRAIKAFLETDTGLAMRSLPRAVPLVALSLAVLLGAGLVALVRRRPSVQAPATVALVALVVAGLPPLWQRTFAAASLRGPEELPGYWHEAADHLTATDDGTRVLEIPGADFTAYRWGTTLDPVTPGLTDRPLAARELVPFGSPPSADLLAAFDRRLQGHIAEPAAFAPIARVLRAGQVLVRSDLQYERYGTPRPRELWDLVGRAPGLGDPVAFGAPRPNLPDPRVPLLDELALSLAPDLADPPPVAVVPVEDVPRIVTAKPTAIPVVVAGDGDGIVDLAAAGLLRGDELLLTSTALDAAQLERALADGAVLVLTDTNRRRGERWGNVRNNRGYTEPAGFEPMVDDLTDNRLPVSPGSGDGARTVAIHRGGLTADATSYGVRNEYLPEDRPANAVDGDPTTAWRTGVNARIVGERLRITLDEPVTVDDLTLLAATGRGTDRFITRARLRFDGGGAIDVDLGPAFREAPGQRIDTGTRRFRQLEIEVLADTAGPRPRYGGLPGAGIAEVDIGGMRLDEVIRLPVDLFRRTGEDSLDHAIAIVLTRLRSAATDAARDDEELALARVVELPAPRRLSVVGAARLSPRAPEGVLDALLGVRAAGRAAGATARSSARLPGIDTRASTAFDGDPSTAWQAPFGTQAGQWLEVRLPSPTAITSLPLGVVADGRHSVPTRVGVEVDGRRVRTVDLPAIDDARDPMTVRPVAIALDQPVEGAVVRLVIDAVRAVTSPDWTTGRAEEAPVAIAEVGIPGLVLASPSGTIDTGCRAGLLGLEGSGPVRLRVQGALADARRGAPLAVTGCGGALELPRGASTLRAAPGRQTGLDIDRLVLRSVPGGDAARTTSTLTPPPGEAPRITVLGAEDDRVSLRVSGAEPGTPFWLSFGQSFNTGWRAVVRDGGRDGETAAAPRLVDGFANGWRVDPDRATFEVSLRFEPQRRVDIALWVSAASALACIALAAFARRGLRRPNTDELPLPLSPFLALNYDGALPSRRRARIVAAGMGLLGLLLVNPVAGAALAFLAHRGMRDDGFRRWIALASPAALIASGTYVVVWSIRHDIPHGFEWPAELARPHPVAWLAVLLLVTDVVVHRAWTAPDT
jgi:hypothetical protein